jgi:sugar lactone lactonase YvrE
VRVVASPEASRQPLDAAPSPDGSVIYFTTTGDAGGAVFRTASDGASAVITVAEGAPLVRPTGIAIADDGARAYLADGALLTVPVPFTGPQPAPTVVPGTEGRSARGLDVVGDDVYFTGTDPGSGAAGLFRVSVAGGAVTTVAAGPPFVSPDSVVVDGKGVAFVTDQGSGSGQGLVLRVANGDVRPLLSGLRLGAPAGVTLVHDDATLLVSSVDPLTHADQVLFLELAGGGTATRVIGESLDSSGGLHRSRDGAVLAWADTSRGGRIYRVEP